jgi:hypothetical protein
VPDRIPKTGEKPIKMRQECPDNAYILARKKLGQDGNSLKRDRALNP